jgi:hypothetical protein
LPSAGGAVLDSRRRMTSFSHGWSVAAMPKTAEIVPPPG